MTSSDDKHRGLWPEIRRRGVIHVAGLYIVTAWVIVQVADIVSQGPFPMPPEALRLIWLALILIFPIMLVFGWRYDVTRHGIVRTDPSAGAECDLPLARADHAIIAGLSLLVAGILGATAMQVSVAIEHDRLKQGIGVETAAAPPPENSIAVLPFLTCSGHEGDSVLAAGLAAEVIDRLAGLGTLKVIARASSFTMASFNLPLTRIAQPLGVKYLLTGEICRRGELLTLSVELVDESGYVFWSERFEQSVGQSEMITTTLAARVSQGVATALGQSFASEAEAPINRLAYEQLVIGREYADRGEFEKARAAFEKALQYDPEYEEVVWQQAELVVWEALSGGDLGLDSVREAKPIAERALEMARRRVAKGRADFNSYATLAMMTYFVGKWEQWLAWNREGMLDEAELAVRLDAASALFEEAETHARSSLALNPSVTEHYELLGYIVERQGIDRRTDALEVFEQGLSVDPFHARINRQVAKRWAARGDYREAMDLLERFEALPEVPPEVRFVQLEIKKLQTYWDEKCELLIELLREEPEAFEHTGVYGHLVWFLSELAQLGLTEEAQAWHERVEQIPAQGWAAVLRGWFLGDYYSIVDLHQEDPAPEDRQEELAMIAGMTDEEILDGGSDGAVTLLADAGDYDRAIRLAESQQRGGQLDSTFWAERYSWPRLRLAALYQAADRNDEAAATLEELVRDLEAEYEDGIRHPTTLGFLAEAYAMQGRDDDALAMLRKAVDYHLRWIEIPEYETFAPWKGLLDDPRFIAQRERIQADLDQQAERIRRMLAQHDVDQLLAPMMELAEERFADAGD
jgi:TolB-like protein/cytochrome c-type biogenesis protein CcmH/NrfG